MSKKKESLYYCELCAQLFSNYPTRHRESKQHIEIAEKYTLADPLPKIPPGGIDYFKKGEEHRRQKRYEVAVEWYAKATEGPWVFFNKGKLESKLKRLTQAEATFNRLTEYPGWEGVGTYYLGTISYKQRKLKNLKISQAENLFQKASKSLSNRTQTENSPTVKVYDKCLISTYLKLSEIYFEKDPLQSFNNAQEALKLKDKSSSDILKLKADEKIISCCKKLGYGYEKYIIRENNDFKEDHVESSKIQTEFPDIKYNGPRISLIKSLSPLKAKPGVLEFCVKTAKDKFKQFQKANPEATLTEEECGAIYLYTVHNPTIFKEVNAALTSRVDRETKLAAWKPYLNYLLGGLSKLKPIDTKKELYRGIKEDVRIPQKLRITQKKYEEGEKITFYAFTSTTMDRSVTEIFLDSGKGTLFIIKDFEGRRNYSGRPLVEGLYNWKEQEVLFPPGATFRITKILSKEKLLEIHLVEVPSILPDIFDNRVAHELLQPNEPEQISPNGKYKRPIEDNNLQGSKRPRLSSEGSPASNPQNRSKSEPPPSTTDIVNYHKNYPQTTTLPTTDTPNHLPPSPPVTYTKYSPSLYVSTQETSYIHYRNGANSTQINNTRSRNIDHLPEPAATPATSYPPTKGLTINLTGQDEEGKWTLTGKHQPNFIPQNTTNQIQPKSSACKTAILFFFSMVGFIICLLLAVELITGPSKY